jgi:Asp-tRNA(Asn)/Glu-tRNA(Gln) amidotransferase A subunit family amidase
MTKRALNEMTLCEMARSIADRTVSSGDLVSACLDRIAAREPVVKAWTFLDADGALAQADRCDEESPRSPLHGIPIGLKDIIDTAEMPTCYGSEVFAAHQLEQDAACVSRLRNAGAVILGKLVTTEFAYYAPGPTTNPHDPAHTPGGSSSGPAAAVADCHVPMALGSQTAGSIIRPASYTGVIGFKPSYGAYPIDGVHPLAPSLDTLGVFTRALEDLALCSNILARSEAHRISEPVALRPQRIAIVRGPYWDEATPAMRGAFTDLVGRIQADGIDCTSLAPTQIQPIIETQIELMARESVATLGPIVAEFDGAISPETRHLVAQGRQVDADADFEQRLAATTRLAQEMLRDIFSAHDLIVTPSAPGEAPAGLESTGDPIFNRAWTFCRVPCIGVPFARGERGLPLGLQFVGNTGDDTRLLHYAMYLRRYSRT